ncbi:type I-U CRISPR-associated protein Csb2 [Pantanalinema rosaneae CENA516]|uniref:type I-G CRISPR-associated protein Csb2 n=1 Tax=Pantanalinema rosaneae TaxID=1620701 RepID=UPI003D6ED4FA
MSVVITISLLNNLYGANPWNTAHIEGKVEYPPSPWRILRSILAGSYLCQEKPIALDSAVYKLSQVRPEFYLPATTYTQHRYYRKDQTNDENLYKGGRKVIEPALRFHQEDNTIWVHFPNVVFSPEEQTAVTQVLPYCRYLGRSEYIADWQLKDLGQMPRPNATPEPTGTTLVLSPIVGQTPSELIEHLNASPRTLRHERQIDLIPGSEWISYSVHSSDAPRFQASATPLYPSNARFQLVGVALPRKEDYLMWAERLHQALVGKCPTSTFTGKDEQGNPLQFAHAYIYPEFDRQGYVTHLNCYHSSGFRPQESKAFLEVKALWGKNGNIALILESLTPKDIYQPSRYWRSTTPFFLSLYPKSRKGKPRMLSGTQFQDCGVEHQALRSLLSLHLGIHPHTISYHQDGERLCAIAQDLPVAWCDRASLFPSWYRWQNVRKSGNNLRGTAEGYQVDIELATPFTGHLSIGYGEYFGLGMLSPMRESVGIEQAIAQEAVGQRTFAIF